MSLKIKFGKKALAAITAASMMFAASGCGEYTSWAMKYGDYTANAGVFIYYQMEALNEAKSILQKENDKQEDDKNKVDLNDKKVLKTLKVENQDIETWVNNKAEEDLKVYLAVNQKFDELGLELPEDKKSEIESAFQMRWLQYGDKSKYEKNGTSEESYKSIIELSYKEKEVFTYYYGKGGELEYSDSDFRAYLEGNYARTKMVKLNLKDGAGTELDDDGKKEVKAMAEDYKKRAIAGESMDDLIQEYTDYYNKLTEEAKAETEGDTTGEDPAVTTEAPQTTPEVTEEAPQTTEASADDADQAEVTSAEDEAASEDSQTESSDTQESDQTEEVTSADENNTEVTTVSDENNSEVTTVSESSESDEPAVTTEPAEDGEDTTGTEAEEDPYPNETILFKGTEEKGYNPSKVVNDAVFNDCTVKGDPMIVEDEENLMIYVVQRLDILERTDFFEGDIRDYLLWEILEDDFRVLELEWIDDSKLNVNDKAIKRYDPMKIEE